MDEIFNKIFESNVLTEESKAEIKQLFETAIAEAKEVASVEVKADLAEQFIAEKENLIEALDTKVAEELKKELDELKEDISRFRDLEVEYSEKLVEARAEMSEIVKSDFKELIETIDKFLDERLEAEFKELKEDIEDAKRMEFGKKIFEAFGSEFKKHFHNKDETLSVLESTKTKLDETSTKLVEAEKELKMIKREKEMNRVLESLQDKPKEVMEAILKNVSTDKLEETYNLYIGRVLHKSATQVEEGSEKESGIESPVLAEGNTSTESTVKTKVVTGDEVVGSVDTDLDKSHLNESTKIRLKRMAGIDA